MVLHHDLVRWTSSSLHHLGSLKPHARRNRGWRAMDKQRKIAALLKDFQEWEKKESSKQSDTVGIKLVCNRSYCDNIWVRLEKQWDLYFLTAYTEALNRQSRCDKYWKPLQTSVWAQMNKWLAELLWPLLLQFLSFRSGLLFSHNILPAGSTCACNVSS